MLNFGDILETIESRIDPNHPACIHGGTVMSWSDFALASNNLARQFLDRGFAPDEKIAIYLRNGPEYVIALAAAFKARLVPVNVNYRYASGELVYLLDNSDARIVCYDTEFRERVEYIRDRLPGVALWLEVCDVDLPPFAERFSALAAAGDGQPVTIERSPDDLFFIYTGGTTGMPKGVMWPHGDLRELMVTAARAKGPIPEDLDQLATYIAAGNTGPRVLPAPPLMHGTGLLLAVSAMLWGGTVITVPGKSFDPAAMLRAIECERPSLLAIVGDSFGRPLLDELERETCRYDLSSIDTITSSGVIWSVEVKRGLLRYMPDAVLNDALSSSEALGLGASVMTADGEVATASFTIGPRCRVLAGDGSWVKTGSSGEGLLALGAPNPLGYYKDADKTAATLKTIDGVRYCIPGDFCRVDEDGMLLFLGRGNTCINTAGEKVFPEEIEEVLKRYQGVADALVVGVPDPKWGQAIVAVVEHRPGTHVDHDMLRDHVRAELAGYKVPKLVLRAIDPLRAVNGKADYATARGHAIAFRKEHYSAE